MVSIVTEERKAVPEEEKQEIRMQISIFRDLYETLEQGDYYRLTDPASETCTVWEQVSRDRRRAVVNAVYHYVTANPGRVYVRLKGLNENVKKNIGFEPALFEKRHRQKSARGKTRHDT